MAFWKDLARYGLMAAPFVAAPFTSGASLALIGAGAGAGRAALDGGGIGDIAMAGGVGAAQGAIPPTPTAQPGTGFWSKIAEQAKEGLKHRDTYTTAAQAISGALAASRANQPSMQDIQTLEYIAGGGREGGQFGLTRRTTEREQEEARKRLKGPGFWSQFLDYGVAPSLAIYGSMLPPNEPEGR